jgi:hypothetical protein
VGSYRTDQIYFQGAARSGNVFTVNVRHTYTLVVTGTTTRPYYYDATPYPQTPNRRDKAFRAAGYQRWALGITMTTSLRSHRYWNVGVKIGTTMHVITIRIA